MKQPIGYRDNRKPFLTHKIQLIKGDIILSFTDGFADQFGGEKGKKYKYKPFREFLLSISKHQLEEQKRLLEIEFISWKGDLDQVDDVCVFSIQIKN